MTRGPKAGHDLIWELGPLIHAHALGISASDPRSCFASFEPLIHAHALGTRASDSRPFFGNFEPLIHAHALGTSSL